MFPIKINKDLGIRKWRRFKNNIKLNIKKKKWIRENFNASILILSIKASCNTEEKANLIEQHNIHLRHAELSRKSLQEDQDLALKKS